MPDTGLIRLFAVPWPTASNSDAGRPVIIETTTVVVSWLSGFGGSGVVYQWMTQNAAIKTAMPATTATGITQAGVPATGLRSGVARRTGRFALTTPW